MEYTRERYLIQHRESKRYIKGSTGSNGKLDTTDNAWKAWGMERAEDALYVIKTNRYMPEDRENYRIVQTIDVREVLQGGVDAGGSKTDHA